VEVEATAGVPETPEQFIARRDAEISKWVSDKESLTVAKEYEGESRAKVATTLFPTPKKGTNRYALNGGYSIKLVYGLNYTLGDKTKPDPANPGEVIPVNQQVTDALARIAELGNEGQELANVLVKWKPELNESVYLQLTPPEGMAPTNIQAEAKAIIDEILTVKPATPQLTFEVPKEKK